MTKKKETIISVALIAALLIVLYVLEQILVLFRFRQVLLNLPEMVQISTIPN